MIYLECPTSNKSKYSKDTTVERIRKMKKDTYEYNKTWEDKVHRHSTNFPLDLWEYILEDMKRYKTNAGDIVRTRLYRSFGKIQERPATKQDIKDAKTLWIHDKPKRFLGFVGILKGNLGAFFRYRRLRELEHARETMNQIFDN
jgi:hypothetical protein